MNEYKDCKSEIVYYKRDFHYELIDNEWKIVYKGFENTTLTGKISEINFDRNIILLTDDYGTLISVPFWGLDSFIGEIEVDCKTIYKINVDNNDLQRNDEDVIQEIRTKNGKTVNSQENIKNATNYNNFTFNEDNYYLHGFVPVGSGLDYNGILNKLISILKYGLVSRKKLEKIYDLKSFGINWNGSDYISLTHINGPNSKEYFINGELNSYALFSENRITLLISDEIEKSCEFRTENHKHMPNEVMVKDYINPKYIMALILPINYHKNMTKEELIDALSLSEFLYDGLEKAGLSLPIINHENMIKIPRLEELLNRKTL